MANPVCPKTGDRMHRGVRPVTFTFKDQSETVDMPGWYCKKCGEGIHTGKDMKESDRALARMKARHAGLPEPEDVRRIRKELGLTQKAAGLLIGGGPGAFQKYESGAVTVNRAVASALTLLEQNPDGLAVLRQRFGEVSV